MVIGVSCRVDAVPFMAPCKAREHPNPFRSFTTSFPDLMHLCEMERIVRDVAKIPTGATCYFHSELMECGVITILLKRFDK